MLLTRESDYALRILRELSDGSQKTVAEICEGGAIPHPFAYKILKKLEHAGMLHISRGSHGGCQCSEEMQGFSLYQVMEAVGDFCRVNACMEEGYECNWECQHQTSCHVHSKLCELQQKVVQELKSVTLGEILAEEESPSL